MPRPRRTIQILAFALVALALAAACSDAAQPAPPPQFSATVAPTLAPPTPEPTPEPEDLGEGLIGLIRRGWESIINYYIVPPEPRSLLVAAWRDVAAAARARGAVPPPQPTMEGGAEEMWSSFAEAYTALLHASAEDAWQGYRFAALEGMTRSLNDCHTFFLPPARADVLTDIRTGRGSGGVGIELGVVRPAFVRETISGGPAQKAGILPGDLLVAVDGRDVRSLGVEAIGDLLRGDPGSAISVEVKRPSTGSILSFPLTRALVRPPVADGYVLEEGIGYMRVRSFTTGPSLREALDAIVADFEAQGVTAWVLDLRDNPGGDSDAGLAGRFVGAAVAERTLLREGGIEVREGEGEPYLLRPLAVLVNGSTASVAEIFAAMIQDHVRGRVFGSVTQKCAGFVNLESYPDGSTLGVTIAHSLTPVSEKPLWQTGVIPDTAVRQTQDDIAAGRDPVRDAAVAWLRTQPP